MELEWSYNYFYFAANAAAAAITLDRFCTISLYGMYKTNFSLATDGTMSATENR